MAGGDWWSTSSSRADGANPRVGLVFALKEADTGRTHGVAQRTGNFESAVAARVVGDDHRGVVLAARDTTADSRRLAGLDRRGRLHLARGSARIWRMGWRCDDTVMTRRKPIS